MPASIRPATRADIPAIAAVHARSWQHAYRGILPDAYLDTTAAADLATHWQGVEIGPGDIVLLAEEDGIVGFITVLCRPDPFIDSLHLRPDRRVRGLGRQLMAAATQALLACGHHTAYLWVLEQNHAARCFYQKLGGVCRERADKDIFGHLHPHLKIAWSDISVMLPRDGD